MRWVLFCLAALISALAVSPSAALADEQAVTIKVTVLGADGKAATSARVLVRVWPDPQGLSMDANGGETKEDGSFTATTGQESQRLFAGTYRISAFDGESDSDTIVYIGPDDKSPVVLTLQPKAGSAFIEADLAAKAAQNGDNAGYEQHAAKARNDVARDEKLADAAQQAADDFARANGLQIKDLRGVAKDFERADKLPADLRDEELIFKLFEYKSQLEAIQGLQTRISIEKKYLADLKPPEKKFGLAPSACPEGQSGGLLAGGINSLFGTDLAGVCDDKQPQHRDTDRQKGGDRRERDEHD